MPEDLRNSELELLTEKKKVLEFKRGRARSRRTLLIFVGVTFLVLGPVLFFLGQLPPDQSILFALFLPLYGVLTLAYGSNQHSLFRDYTNDLQTIETEEQLIRNYGEPRDFRAERLFRVHQRELKRYYDQTLRHSSWIFLAGLIILGLGFVVIFITLNLIVSTSSGGDPSQNIFLAFLGGAGAVLADFVAVVYLRMYSSTTASLTEFHSRFVLTHRLHFANFLASKIDDDDTRRATLKEMAIAITREGEPKKESEKAKSDTEKVKAETLKLKAEAEKLEAEVLKIRKDLPG